MTTSTSLFCKKKKCIKLVGVIEGITAIYVCVHTQTHAKFTNIIKTCSADFFSWSSLFYKKMEIYGLQNFHNALKLYGFFGIIQTVTEEQENWCLECYEDIKDRSWKYFFLGLWGCELDEPGWELYPVTLGFCISRVEPSGCISRQLIWSSWYIYTCPS
jgi:hypothetical protein